MSTTFSYWFLSEPVLPAFAPPSTPKEFLLDHFSSHHHSSYVTGALPASSPVARAELVAAGLSAGYGKQGAWRKTYWGPTGNREALYKYLRRRLEMTLACVHVSAGKMTPKSFWGGVEPSEKGSLSFNLGSLGAAVAAKRWMSGAGHDVRRFLHTRLFVASGFVRGPLHFHSYSESLPDYLVEDSAGGWHVFEAKGGDKGNRWKQLVDGLQQLAPVVGVGGMGHPTAPLSSVCVQTLVHQGCDLEFTLADPPVSEEKPPASLRIEVLGDLADLALCFEALDWFDSFADRGQFQGTDPAAVAVRLPGYRVATSAAFGGMTLALPEAYFAIRPKVRAALRVVAEFKALLEWEEERSADTATDEQLMSRVRASGLRLSAPPAAASEEEDAGAVADGLTALQNLMKKPPEGDFHEWRSEMLRELSSELGIAPLAKQCMEARQAFPLDATHSIATSAGGLVVVLDDDRQ